MTAEQALAWAVRDEWPKVGAAARLAGHGAPNGYVTGSGFAQMIALGQKVDNHKINAWGVIPFEIDMGAPHPDAVALSAAIDGLDRMVAEHGGLGVPHDWEPFGDFAALGAHPEGERLLALARHDARVMAGALALERAQVRRLVVKAAILGLPRGEGGDVAVEIVRHEANGAPMWFRMVRRAVSWNAEGEATAWDMVEADGFDAKARRPFPDAYRKHALRPDPRPLAIARAEWQIWRAALDAVCEMCADAMTSIEIMPSALPWAPWEACGIEAGPRVLSGGPALPKEAAPVRPVAGRPLSLMAAEDHAARAVARFPLREGLDCDRRLT